MDALFGTDGIRGQANRYPITSELALQVGKAIGRVIGAQGHGSRRVVIGKDTRLSGYMLETALTSGLVAMGADVFLVGPVPSPAVAHLTKSLAADAGIMITASHNPSDDNGIKIFNPDGYKFDDAREDEVARLVLSGEISSEHIRSDRIGKAYRIDDASGRYIEFAKNTIRNEKLNPLKIVLDCANGAAYHIAPLIFQELGAEVVKTHVGREGFGGTRPSRHCARRRRRPRHLQ
jgi:phosphoglucosamine mutase